VASKERVPVSSKTNSDSEHSKFKQTGTLQKNKAHSKNPSSDDNEDEEIEEVNDSESDNDCVVISTVKSKNASRPAHQLSDAKNEIQQVGTVSDVKNKEAVCALATLQSKGKDPYLTDSTLSSSHSSSTSKISLQGEPQLSRNETQLLVRKVFELETSVSKLKKELSLKVFTFNMV